MEGRISRHQQKLKRDDSDSPLLRHKQCSGGIQEESNDKHPSANIQDPEKPKLSPRLSRIPIASGYWILSSEFY